MKTLITLSLFLTTIVSNAETPAKRKLILKRTNKKITSATDRVSKVTTTHKEGVQLEADLVQQEMDNGYTREEAYSRAKVLIGKGIYNTYMINKKKTEHLFNLCAPYIANHCSQNAKVDCADVTYGQLVEQFETIQYCDTEHLRTFKKMKDYVAWVKSKLESE